MAGFGAADVERLLGDAGIVRNRAKIEATIGNARAILQLRAAGRHAALDSSGWIQRSRDADHRRRGAMSRASTPEAAALARELKGLGFRFLGPTTLYALMQACGVVDDHLAACPTRPAAERARRAAGLI